MARAALPIFSPNCGRTRTMTGVSACAILRRFLHGAGELLEIARFAEIAIDRCEADIGDTVDLAQAVHHHLADARRSEEHPSEIQSLMRSSSAVFCLKKKN